MYSVDMDQKPMSSLQRKNRMKRMEEIRYSHDESLYNLQEENSETDPEYDYDSYDRNEGYGGDYRERRQPQQRSSGGYNDSYDDYHYQQQPDDYRLRKTVSMYTQGSRKQQPMSRDSRYSERSNYDQKNQIPTIDEDDDYRDNKPPQKVLKAKLRLHNLQGTSSNEPSPSLPSPKSPTRPSSLKSSSNASSSKHSQQQMESSPRISEEIEYETHEVSSSARSSNNEKKNSKDANVVDDESKGEAVAATTPETPTAKKSFKMHLVPNKKLFKVPEINQLSKLSNLFNSAKNSATNKLSKKDESNEKSQTAAAKESSTSQKSEKIEKNKKPQDAKQNSKVSSASSEASSNVVANAHHQQTNTSTQEENKKVSKEKKDSKSHSTNIEKRSSVNSNEFEVNFHNFLSVYIV